MKSFNVALAASISLAMASISAGAQDAYVIGINSALTGPGASTAMSASLAS